MRQIIEDSFKIWLNIIHYIKDFDNVWKTVIVIFCIAVAVVVTVIYKKRLISFKRVFPLIAVIVYIFSVFVFTLFSRKVLDERHLNLDAFGTIVQRLGDGIGKKQEIICNFLLLIPFGIMFPAASKNPGFVKTTIIGFTVTLTIEILQYVFQCGYSEASDIVVNTVGVMTGYGIYKGLKILKERL